MRVKCLAQEHNTVAPARAHTGINGVLKTGPSHLLSKNGDLSFLFFFSKQCLVENIQGKFPKKIHWQLDFLFRGIITLNPAEWHFRQILKISKDNRYDPSNCNHSFS